MKMLGFFLAGASAAGLAACATAPELRHYSNADLYVGAEHLYAADYIATQPAPRENRDFAAPAPRLAQAATYPAGVIAVAAAPTSACGEFVSFAEPRHVDEIAALCNVPVEALFEANPSLTRVSLIQGGEFVRLPSDAGAPAGAFAMTQSLAELYRSQQGDTLDKVADKLNVSASLLLAANPTVSWTTLPADTPIRVPATAPSKTASTSGAPWLGYTGRAAGLGESEAGAYASSGGNYGMAQAPYARDPASLFVSGSPGLLTPEVAVEKRVAKPEDRIPVTVAERLPPGTSVTIYRGERISKMKRVGAATANKDGVVSTVVGVPKAASAGGVVVRATRDDTGAEVFSQRIGVVRLADPNKPAPVVEDKEEENHPLDE